ncbi:MAG: plasmid pRiA4b ORF-3 family protein [Komarekiella atlantica HA4396-MV6]|jgi:hypothetical protein|nr:plasmid pRiA4b ORF-3 family protein [Komarekiella atlantica HA4396-MV6]
MIDPAERVIYQLKVVLLGISPMIWRRVKVSSDSTIEDLHYTIQLAMGWKDIHLHHFIIHGKYYGITQPGVCFYPLDDQIVNHTLTKT